MISLEIFNARGEVREPIQLAAEIPPIIRPNRGYKAFADRESLRMVRTLRVVFLAIASLRVLH